MLQFPHHSSGKTFRDFQEQNESQKSFPINSQIVHMLNVEGVLVSHIDMVVDNNYRLQARGWK